ncbi:hypothetical protein COOONC_02627 [Cooperia oncophora]
MKLPSGRLCKRPVNLLVPLELEEHIEPGKEANERSQAADAKRYNLRPRRKVSYKEDSGHAAAVTSSISRSIATSTLFVCLTMLLIIPGALSLSPTATISGGQLTCIEGGVSIITRQIRSFELCVEGICQVSNNPRDNETILFPPEVLLHKHHVQLKLSDGQNITVLETSCPEVAFCEHVRCWLCTANIFNPQCSPRTAIAGIAIIVYIAIALLYALCYVPLVIGKPFRIGGRIAWSICRGFCWCLRRIRRWQGHRRRRFDVETLLRAPLIAAAMVIIVASATLACQDINVFSSENSICTISSKGKKECSLETTEIVKINSFSREGCIRLFDNSTVQKEIRIQWKGVRLTCQKTNAFFTRSTSQRTIDSKRCSHSGSCVASKCESIKTTSLIPELSQGNQYPGITRCVESCGGPGCGCFYLSSGCLFYRIFHVPVDEKVYELFKCSIWKEEVLLDVTVISHKHKTITNRTTAVKPTTEKTSRYGTKNKHLHLQCDSEESARTLNCTATTSCNCDPAENKVKCLCQDVNITESFTKEIGSRFPIRRPWITFTADTTKKVTAHIPSLVAAEVFVQLREKFERTVKVVTDERCMVPNSVAKGCYRCLQGAEAEIYCTTDGNSTMATVQCDEEYFTIPCTPSGATTIWRFSHPSAKVKKECQVSCGSTTTRFEITGILQWVRTLSGAAARIAQGESNVYNEMILPDFSHIFDVILHWYKTLLSTVVLVALALIVGYILLWTCGLRVLIQLIRTPFRLMSRIIKIVTKSKPNQQRLPQANPRSRPQPPPLPTRNPSSSSKTSTETSECATSKRKLGGPQSSGEEDLLFKKGHASGTFLKDLLHQGGRILLHAASKVDQLAPAVVPSHEAIQHLQQLEQQIKNQQEQITQMQNAVEAKMEKLLTKTESLITRVSEMEKNNTRTEDMNTLAKTICEDLFKRLQNFFESKNAHSALCQPSTERSSRIQSDVPKQHAPAEPLPEEERIKRQLRETERELETVEKELVGVRNAIEAEWEPDDDEKEVSHERLDRLRERKYRLQANKARLEQERRQLHGRLEKERRQKHSNPENETRQKDNNRGVKRSRTQEHQMERKDDRNRPRSRDQTEEDGAQRDRNRHARDRSKRRERRTEDSRDDESRESKRRRDGEADKRQGRQRADTDHTSPEHVPSDCTTADHSESC